MAAMALDNHVGTESTPTPSTTGAPQPGPASSNAQTQVAGDHAAGEQGADQTPAEHIAGLRNRIDEIDDAIIALWQERATLSQQVGATRVASGGTRLVLSREREILDRFRAELGADGTQLALLLLRAGRGRL